MKKSLLFSLLTVCAINSALAENIQNLDTPVNWSISATFNTIMKLHQNDPNAFSIADDVASKVSIYGFDEPISAKELCELYIDSARSYGSKVYNCSDVITELIAAHNNIVLSQKNTKIIDKLMPDTKVYWTPAYVDFACMVAISYAEKNDVSLRNQTPNGNICNYRGTLDLYNKPYSINNLFDLCQNFFFTSSNRSSLNTVCQKFVDEAASMQNISLRNEEQIKYDDNFEFKYTSDKEKEENRREKFLSYNNKIIDLSYMQFDSLAEAHIWAMHDIENRIVNDITDIKSYELFAKCSGDCNKYGDDIVTCDVTYKKDTTITVKYIFDDICNF